MNSYNCLHTESVEPVYVNFRSQGQRKSQSQMIKMTYFKTK